MRCLTCHYDLRHLAEHRCPECGRVFNPNDPRTFTTVEAERLRDANAGHWIAAGCVLMWLTGLCVRVYYGLWLLDYPLLATLALGVVVGRIKMRNQEIEDHVDSNLKS